MSGLGIFLLVGVVLLLVLLVLLMVLVLTRLRGSRRSSVDPTPQLGESSMSGEQQREVDDLLNEAQHDAAESQRLKAEARRLQDDAQALRDGAERLHTEAQSRRADTETWVSSEQTDLRKLRSALDKREQRLTDREEHSAQEAARLDTRAQEISAADQQLEDARGHLAEQQDTASTELHRVAALSSEDARAEVLARAEHDARLEATALARDLERSATRDAERIARRIITTAIQRVASDQTSESVVSTIDLPSEEMKGRIIGREGRNIRAFEQVTGVNVMIDDTPESVLLSCFDPVRREIARLALIDLVADGRIHPARIEEAHARAETRIAERCQRAAEDALAEVGIADLHPDLYPILGALQYRTSYGQNVLRHLVECGHLAGMMAAELGLDARTCTRAAFLHDIGKALTHQSEGSHAIVGAELARKHGEHPDIVHAIEAHHNEVEPTTVEAILTQAADAISGSRPGARREALESYVHRLNRLEEIAASHPGVDRVFAMQAGREVRVMVSPEVVDDIASHELARSIARQVESELTYPGQIRITVVRESRATETAH